MNWRLWYSIEAKLNWTLTERSQGSQGPTVLWLRIESKHHILGWHCWLTWRYKRRRIGKVCGPKIDVVVEKLGVEVRIGDRIKHNVPWLRGHPESRGALAIPWFLLLGEGVLLLQSWEVTAEKRILRLDSHHVLLLYHVELLLVLLLSHCHVECFLYCYACQHTQD